MSSGTVAVLVARTGRMLKVKVPADEHPAGSGEPVHWVTVSPRSLTEMVTGHCGTPAQAGPGVRSAAFRRRRAPVEHGVVEVHVVEVVVEVEETGTGIRTLIWPEVESFCTVCEFG